MSRHRLQVTCMLFHNEILTLSYLSPRWTHSVHSTLSFNTNDETLRTPSPVWCELTRTSVADCHDGVYWAPVHLRPSNADSTESGVSWIISQKYQLYRCNTPSSKQQARDTERSATRRFARWVSTLMVYVEYPHVLIHRGRVCHTTKPSLVQIMACRLFGAKPLSKPMLPHCPLNPLNTFQ